MVKKGLHVRNEGTYKRTDLLASDALWASGWVAGTPLAVDATGLIGITIDGVTGATDMLCVALKSSEYDMPSGGSEKVHGEVLPALEAKMCATLHGSNSVDIYGDDLSGAVVKPFEATPTSGTWAIGAEVFVNATNGTWDDVAGGTSSEQKAWGVVMDVYGDPTDADGLQIEFYKFNG